ncbi:hypothetical protein [Helicobacter sp. 16-1353]|nr:hypothetical protein [Helicobacter sp. 16-1353]
MRFIKSIASCGKIRSLWDIARISSIESNVEILVKTHFYHRTTLL